jgi:hypothetical protein
MYFMYIYIHIHQYGFALLPIILITSLKATSPYIISFIWNLYGRRYNSFLIISVNSPWMDETQRTGEHIRLQKSQV